VSGQVRVRETAGATLNSGQPGGRASGAGCLLAMGIDTPASGLEREAA
jgi:hypothetical protein